MARRVNPALVGAFVIGAAALIVAAISLMASKPFFHHRHLYILYFQSSVHNLSVGAAVRFHGVKIGSVNRILLSLTQLNKAIEKHDPSMVRVPVEIELDERTIQSLSGQVLDLDNPDTVKRLIDGGLRAQLALESFLTGILYVELDLHPGPGKHKPVLEPNPLYQEIPTESSELEQVQENIGKLLARLSQVDFPKAVTSVKQMSDSIRTLVQSPQLQQTLGRLDQATKSLEAAAQSAQRLTETIRGQVVPLSRSLQDTSGNAAETLRQARAAMIAAQQAFTEAQASFVEARAILDPGSPITYQLGKTLEEISGAARSIRELADYLQRNPSAVIRGRAVSQDER